MPLLCQRHRYGKALTAAFKQQFPFMDVEEFEATGAPLLEKYLSEKRAGIHLVDVVQMASPSLIQRAIDEGYISTYVVTSEKQFPSGSYVSGLWYPSLVATNVYMYNTTLVTEEQAEKLTTYEGLWDPVLSGLQIAIQNVAASATSQDYFYYLDTKYGRESWRKLKTLNVKIYEPLPAVDAVSRGEAAITYVGESLALSAWIAKAPIRWRVPEPAIVKYDPTAIASSPPHPNAARLFQEFLLSRKGQAVYNSLAEASVRADVGELRPVKDETWFQKAPDRRIAPDFAAEKDKALAKLIEDWKALFVN